MIIYNDGKCITQPSPYDDPVFNEHHPIKPTVRYNMGLEAVLQDLPQQVPVSLIEFTGRDGNTYHVNPCRNCGALIAYLAGKYRDEF